MCVCVCVCVCVCMQPVAHGDREVIARLRNCVMALAEHRMMLYDTSVLYAYEISARYQVRCQISSFFMSPNIS